MGDQPEPVLPCKDGIFDFENTEMWNEGEKLNRFHSQINNVTGDLQPIMDEAKRWHWFHQRYTSPTSLPGIKYEMNASNMTRLEVLDHLLRGVPKPNWNSELCTLMAFAIISVKPTSIIGKKLTAMTGFERGGPFPPNDTSSDTNSAPTPVPIAPPPSHSPSLPTSQPLMFIPQRAAADSLTPVKESAAASAASASSAGPATALKQISVASLFDSNAARAAAPASASYTRTIPPLLPAAFLFPHINNTTPPKPADAFESRITAPLAALSSAIGVDDMDTAGDEQLPDPSTASSSSSKKPRGRPKKRKSEVLESEAEVRPTVDSGQEQAAINNVPAVDEEQKEMSNMDDTPSAVVAMQVEESVPLAVPEEAKSASLEERKTSKTEISVQPKTEVHKSDSLSINEQIQLLIKKQQLLLENEKAEFANATDKFKAQLEEKTAQAVVETQAKMQNSLNEANVVIEQQKREITSLKRQLEHAQKAQQKATATSDERVRKFQDEVSQLQMELQSCSKRLSDSEDFSKKQSERVELFMIKETELRAAHLQVQMEVERGKINLDITKHQLEKASTDLVQTNAMHKQAQATILLLKQELQKSETAAKSRMVAPSVSSPRAAESQSISEQLPNGGVGETVR